ncbi:MAG: DDE transposase family protein [Bacteroidales bacterium]
MKNSDKKEWAQLLITRHGYTQKEAAEKVGTSLQTMNRWYKQGNWKMLTASIVATKQEQLRNLYMHLANLNEDIKSRENKFPTPSDSDNIAKLTSSIDKLETDVGITDVISVAERFLSWYKKIDLQEAQKIAQVLNVFINEMLKK